MTRACFVSRCVAALAAIIAQGYAVADAETADSGHCRPDTMLVFDASGSMSGTDWNSVGVPRIGRVREALDVVLPEVAPMQRIGLIVYGPGPYNRCNVELKLQPKVDAARDINAIVAELSPAGKTPLVEGVRRAADALYYRDKPGIIVLLTDGEETCGGAPCSTAQQLKADAADLTIHVIGYIARESVSGRGLLEARCIAEQTGGLYISVETAAQLIAALRRTLGCPELSSLGVTTAAFE